MGAAISFFDGATAVKVPRTRFFPVKKCDDLLAVRSDCYLVKDEKLIENPKRKLPSIRISLDPKFFGNIDGFNERFKEGIPSLLRCESLAIYGDVFFEKNVGIEGNVVIANRGNSRAVIKENSVLAGDITF